MLVDLVKSWIFLTNAPNPLVGFRIKGSFVWQLPDPFHYEVYHVVYSFIQQIFTKDPQIIRHFLSFRDLTVNRNTESACSHGNCILMEQKTMKNNELNAPVLRRKSNTSSLSGQRVSGMYYFKHTSWVMPLWLGNMFSRDIMKWAGNSWMYPKEYSRQRQQK